MAETMIALPTALQSPEARDFVRDLLAYAADRVMDPEAGARCGVEYGERSPARTNSRNGYRGRTWDTRLGTVEL